MAIHTFTSWNAIEEEKKINQDIHNVKGIVTSNIGQIIEAIINETIE